MRRASRPLPAPAPRNGSTPKAMWSLLARVLPAGARQTFEQFDCFASNFFVGDSEKSMHQLGAVFDPARRNFIENVIGPRVLIGKIGKKIIDRRPQRPGDVIQTAAANTIGPVFVFLDLLKCNAKRFCELLLRHLDRNAPQSNSLTHHYVNRLGFLLHGLPLSTFVGILIWELSKPKWHSLVYGCNVAVLIYPSAGLALSIDHRKARLSY